LDLLAKQADDLQAVRVQVKHIKYDHLLVLQDKVKQGFSQFPGIFQAFTGWHPG
jgi:hypothetical protein